MNINNLQDKVEEFLKEKNLTNRVDTRIIDLTSEVGELSKEYLKITDYGIKAFKPNSSFELELGDVLFSLVCLANAAESDLEKIFEKTIKKYQDRFEDHNDIGSKK